MNGGRSYDLMCKSRLAIRSILDSLAKLALTEDVVGEYPSRMDEEPSAAGADAPR